MIRRSYLSRIAQPMTAGDPVIASMPRAAAEESRQTVSAAMRPLAKASPDLATTPSAPHQASSGNIQPRPSRLRSSPAQDATSLRTNTIPISTVPKPPPPASAAAPELSRAESGFGERVTNRTPESASQTSGVGGPRTTSPDRPAHANGVSPPRWIENRPAPPPSPEPSKEGPPRLHIGAIEVRIPRAPNPPPTQPIMTVVGPGASAAHAISRPYASRFGLAQG
jgi:hypothetical protein